MMNNIHCMMHILNKKSNCGKLRMMLIILYLITWYKALEVNYGIAEEDYEYIWNERRSA
jgi:hypothetical protein